MSISAIVRTKRLSRARSILGVVLVAWLNLALQPCAMAFQSEQDPDCPHCPPSQTHHHDGHDMSMVADKVPCASSASNCDVLGDLNNNERSDRLKLNHFQKDLPAIVAPDHLDVGLDQTIELTAVSLSMNRPPGSLLPLHKLYCVYLD